MLTAAKKGRAVNEAEMPPPVATGAQSTNAGSAVPQRPAPSIPSPPPPPPPSESSPSEQPMPSRPETSGGEEPEPSLNAAPSPEEPTEEPAGQPQTAGLEYQLFFFFFILKPLPLSFFQSRKNEMQLKVGLNAVR